MNKTNQSSYSGGVTSPFTSSISPLPTLTSHTSKLDNMLNLSFSNDRNDDEILQKEEEKQHNNNNNSGDDLLTMIPPPSAHIPSSMTELLKEWGVPSPRLQPASHQPRQQPRQHQKPQVWSNDVRETQAFVHNEVTRVRMLTRRTIESIRRRLQESQHKLLNHRTTTTTAANDLPQRHVQEFEAIYERIYGILNDTATLVNELTRLVGAQQQQQQQTPIIMPNTSPPIQQQQHSPPQYMMMDRNTQFIRDLENRVKEAWSTQASSPQRPTYHHHHDNNSIAATPITTASTTMPGDRTMMSDRLSVAQLLKRSERNFKRLEKSLAELSTRSPLRSKDERLLRKWL